MTFKKKIISIMSDRKSNRVYIYGDIPEKQLNNASKELNIHNDEILCLIDTTILGSCKTGMAIGLKGIYWKNDWATKTLNNFATWESLIENKHKLKAKMFSVLSINDDDNISLNPAEVTNKEVLNDLISIISIYKTNDDTNKKINDEKQFINNFTVSKDALSFDQVLAIFPEKLSRERDIFKEYIIEEITYSGKDTIPDTVYMLTLVARSINLQTLTALKTHDCSTISSNEWFINYLRLFLRHTIYSYINENLGTSEHKQYIDTLIIFCLLQIDPLKKLFLTDKNFKVKLNYSAAYAEYIPEHIKITDDLLDDVFEKEIAPLSESQKIEVEISNRNFERITGDYEQKITDFQEYLIDNSENEEEKRILELYISNKKITQENKDMFEENHTKRYKGSLLEIYSQKSKSSELALFSEDIKALFNDKKGPSRLYKYITATHETYAEREMARDFFDKQIYWI